MNRNVFLLIISLVMFLNIAKSQEKNHSTFSLGFTEEIRTDNWIDDYSLDLRVFKNLDNGFAIGGKVGTDFIDKVDFGLALRKTIVKTLFVYGDGGYTLWDEDGFFGEAGIGTYFLKDNRLGITLGAKHYFEPALTSMAVGFIINF
ncbi:hypothetical protein DMA11_05620 [Marinilabiliaceae bacterium JC017]|nr:hypothetical protein DMA11_05620 [Marinilabiliaceae bacterium JC017]